MAVEVERLITVLEARLDGYNRNLTQAQAMTNRQLGQIERRFDQMAARLRASSSSAAMGIRGMLGGLGAYLGVHQIKEYADSWNQVTRSLEASEQIFGLRLRSASELNKLANESRIDNDAFAKLYIRTAAATRELGVAEADVAKVTQTVSMALKLGSASASEQTSTMLQLSQALQKGKLDGDEFRTVMENAGVIQELLADKLQVSKGEIVRMAAAGKISVDLFFSALLDGGEKVKRIFMQMPSTISEGFLVLDNNIEEYIGNLDRAYGSTEAMVAGLKMLSDNVEPLGDSLLVLSGALLAAFAPRIIAGIATMTLGIAAAAGPIGLIAGGLAGATVYAERFGDTMNFNVGLMREAIDSGADFGAAWEAAFSDADKSGVTLQDTFRALTSVMLEEVNELFARLGSMLDDDAELITGLRNVFNKLIGAAVFAYDAIVATFTKMPQAIGEKVIDAINTILRGLQSLIDGATDGLNSLIAGMNKIPGVEVGFLTAPDLGQIENKFAGAGEAAGKAFSDAAGNFSRDWIGEATEAVSKMASGLAADLGDVMNRVDQKARANKDDRQWRQGTKTDREVPNKPVIPTQNVDKAAEKARKNFEKDILRAEQRIAMAKLEADAIGRSAEEVEYMRTRQELLNEARKAGIELTDADMIRIEALAQGTARAVTAYENLKRAQEEVAQESKEMLSQFIKDMKNGVSASEALGSALDRIADKLIDMAVNDLVELALGGLSGKGGNPQQAGLASGLLSLFGFKDGGVAANGRPQPLPRFAGGGVSRSAAIFGEAGPEAAVPLPDGRRIPVDLRMPEIPRANASGGGNVSITVAPVFNVENGSPQGIDKMQSEVLPKIRDMVDQRVGQLFDRKARFARSGI